ncbi:hypothetical protein [Paramicrobacterium chengjingii]|uniref:hypothetical protein n=1 Tax=Paramicrobacterium chengjingii TaxID=2769067 RepID=UPI001420290D|nr:hypothetical protein [Microbacterium chengjingii]
MTLEKHRAISPSQAVHDVIAPELPERVRWHRLLLLTAAAMGVTAVVTTLLIFIDPVQITGQNGWYKPLKFAISISVYSVSLSWLIGLLRRGRRAAEIAGTVSAIALLIEMVIIVGAAAVGTTSHFNVSTPLHVVMLTVMAVSTVVIWAMALVVAIAVIVNPGTDHARNLTVRAATLVGLIGMGLGSLMVFPTAQQLDGGGVVGAHAVGVPDGGVGRWSRPAGTRLEHRWRRSAHSSLCWNACSPASADAFAGT